MRKQINLHRCGSYYNTESVIQISQCCSQVKKRREKLIRKYLLTAHNVAAFLKGSDYESRFV